MSRHLRFRPALLALGVVFTTSPSVVAQDDGHDRSHTAKAPHRASAGDPYLLDTDPATGEKLGPAAKQVVIEHEGRELRFNGEESVRTFRSDPAKFLAKVDKAVVRQQLPLYPLVTCRVSGEKLGGKGEPVDFVYRNRLIRFCCDGCEPTFQKDPSKYLAELDAAVVAAQGPKYPLETCVVSGEKLGGEMGAPVDLVVGNRLVRLCCKGCKKEFTKEPLSFLAKLHVAKGADGHGEKGHGHGHDHDDHDHDKDRR